MNIRRLASGGRGPMLDFLPEPDAAALGELIVSFANAVGGTIVVGMDEQGLIYPDASEQLEPALERALRMCEPPFRAVDLPEWQSEAMSEGLVTTITVKPTAYQLSLGGKEVFVRSGTLNIRLTPEQVARGEGEGRGASFEDSTVPGATLGDFDEAVLEEYQRNRVKRGPRAQAVTRTELLRDAGAIDADGRPTVAGLLLFGANPQYFFPQVGAVVVRFKGKSVQDAITSSERYSRRVEIVGPAARVVERAWEVLFEEIHGESYMKGLERRDYYQYPVEAVREAVVNTVCHRDYSIAGQRIEIRLFDDRIEFMSPGGLPGHITVDNILEEHYSRNPRIVRGLYYWGYIEELGQGIDIICEAMRREHHPSPEFRDTGRSFTVTLSGATDQIELQYGDELNPRQIRALRFLATHERITNRRYRQLCPEVTAETLRLDFRYLVEQGFLLKIGDKRGTYYVRK